MSSIHTIALALLLFQFIPSLCSKTPEITKVKVPLYIRQSWLKATSHIFTTCICSSGVNSTTAYNAIMFSDLIEDAYLKCFINCLNVNLNLMECTTGDFIEEEHYRLLEGCTPHIFKKCERRTRNFVDLCEKSFHMLMCIIESLGEPAL
ncbi:hypothetical protein FQA39_LY06320 [Lamprigera yunnana]|nr:hypothetical protein FQA39_LY06320 [Lamprigera yunnana]